MSKYDTLYRIVAPHFVAGLGVGIDGIVNWSAPIIHYMVGWQLERVLAYCARKDWKLEVVGGYPPASKGSRAEADERPIKVGNSPRPDRLSPERDRSET